MSDEGDLGGAMKVHEETRKTAEELGDKRGVAMAIYNMGEMERLQGNLPRSRTLFDEALTLRRSLEDKSAIARTQTSIGMGIDGAGPLARGEKTHEEALALQESVGDKLGIARVRNLLGSLTLHEGRPVDAQTSIRQAATEFHQMKALDEEAAALAGLARALLAERKTEEADRAIQEAVRLVKDSRNRQWRLEVDLGQGASPPPPEAQRPRPGCGSYRLTPGALWGSSWKQASRLQRLNQPRARPSKGERVSIRSSSRPRARDSC